VEGIPPGTVIYTVDGWKLGVVSEGNAGYVVVRGGTILPGEYFVPTVAIERAEPGRAILCASVAEVVQSGWDRGQAGGA
jgi:hypothetical protein